MFSSLDIYCERVSAGWFQEPLNTWSNLLFPIAAFAVLWYCRRRDDAPSFFLDKMRLLLCAEICGLGIASWTYHASGLALFSIFDSLMIVVFLSTATFALLVRGVALSRLQAVGGVGIVLVCMPLIAELPFVKTLLPGGGHYIPAISTLLVIALLIRRQANIVGSPALLRSAAGIAAAFAVMVLSLTTRTIDLPLCDEWTYGTHFLWHALNALALFLGIVSLPRATSKIEARH